MLVLEEDNISSFDVDGTLVIWPKNPNIPRIGTIEFVYGDEKVYLYPHKPHIRFLKNCSLRGDYVEVWSKNNFAWAKQVVEKLDLEKYVDIARSKPARHIDDKQTLEEIVGGRVYMEYDPEDV
jgi:hypothetical protein